MIDFSFELPQVWLTRPAGADWFRPPPLLIGDVLVARAGSTVVGIDADSGERRWRRELDQRGGVWMAPISHGVVVDLRDEGDRTTVLVGVSAVDGEVMWRRPLGAIVPRDAASWDPETWIGVGRNATGQRTLVVVDCRTGELSAERQLPMGGSKAVAFGDGYAIARAGVDEGSATEPGLYHLGVGGAIHVIDERPAWNVARVAGTLLSVRRAGNGATEVVARTGDDLETVWTSASQGEELGVGLAEVVIVDASSGKSVPILRDVMTGAERWRGAALGASAAFRGVSGPLAYFRGSDGLWLYRLDDGQLLGTGDGDFSFGVTARDGRVYLGVEDALLCAALPFSSRTA